VQGSDTGKQLRNGVSWAQSQLGYTGLWDLGRRGAGQTVAVIDTGVTPGAAFGARLQPGGDYVVAGGDGLDDCDGHGTIVAGLIAASADRETGFAGVAPAARVISIRQSSSYYGVQDARQGTTEQGAGTTVSLAQAIVRAVTEGATVVNISEASCRRGGQPTDFGTRAVRAAVQVAIANDVVVVAAAGNVDTSTHCKTQNRPGTDPATIPTPAAIPGVLTVAAVDQDGRPAPFSLAGDWVDVAAPGTGIISTNPVPGAGGQINQFVTSAGVSPIQGTSFAAPYVAGVVALVRARFPELDAQQVIDRITRTAVHPAAPGGFDDYVGHGTIDPRAALTAVLPGETAPAPPPRSGPRVLPAARPRSDPERSAREVALIGSAAVFVALLVAAIALASRRRDHTARATASAPRARSSGRG
jgi:membrane-anchored mycosin MYCP